MTNGQPEETQTYSTGKTVAGAVKRSIKPSPAGRHLIDATLQSYGGAAVLEAG
jgi:hypothetical protein